MKPYAAFLDMARQLDANDPLAELRQRFGEVLDQVLYLDGNSLGPLPMETRDLMERTVSAEWGNGMIRSWNGGWHDLPRRLGDQLAPLVGASEGEVIFCDSVTVNFHKLASAAMRLQRGRSRIVTDELNFPSNFYALEGLCQFVESAPVLHRIPSADGTSVPVKAYEEAIDDDTALITLSHVVFKSGYKQDLERITRAAHRHGALVLADLSHSAGSVPVELNRWDVDLAVGCSYKFLNGGPGAPAFLYVRQDLINRLPASLSGWFGCADPFAFEPGYRPAKGIERFLVGTPPILSMRAIEPGIRLLREAGMDRIRAKSVRQTELLIGLWEHFLHPQGFELGSPRDPEQRGSHVSLRHPEAYRINKAMIHPAGGERPIIPDFRKPDNLRLGVAPLYLSHTDIVHAVRRIQHIVESGEYRQHTHDADPVT